MRAQLTVVTRKGQITLPANIRRAMGLRQGDKVAVVLEDGTARLSPAGSVVDRTAGAAATREPPLTAEQMRQAAEIAWAEDADERGR